MRAAWVVAFALWVGCPLALGAEDLTPRLRELEEQTERTRGADDDSRAASRSASGARADDGWGGIVLAVVGVGLLALAVGPGTRAYRRRREARRDSLFAKYRDDAVVERILSGTVWQGETAEQVFDSLGKPADVDERVLPTKHLQVWKYGRRGGDRFRLRVVLEDDVVVGWKRA
jgi:hypothetical protein